MEQLFPATIFGGNNSGIHILIFPFNNSRSSSSSSSSSDIHIVPKLEDQHNSEKLFPPMNVLSPSSTDRN
jgi:hypothetical protein